MNLIVISYIIYLILSIGVAIWVAEVLFGNARLFFDDIFHGDQLLSDSTNKLLKMGFYLLCFGFILFQMETYQRVNEFRELFELLSIKVGTIVLTIGVIYLANVFGFFKIRQKANIRGGLRLTNDARVSLEAVEKEILK